MFRYLASALVFGVLMVSFAAAQEKGLDSHDGFNVQSPVGDLHLGKDADAQKTGLPLYPGARQRQDKENDPLNFGILTSSFGLKLVIAKYESGDAPEKIVAYYRDKLIKKYGKVLECRTSEHDGDAHADVDDEKHSKELTCEGDNSGPVTELKVGTQDNQHVVAIEPKYGHSGSEFTLVYVFARGKQGDI
ncbi:MAG: hypothetical protein ABSA78_21395 [Candidatus Sulfotelmatobacter sp.]|jgi:hypothetical protein